MNKTTANLLKLTDFIFQHGLSDEDIIIADASKHEAKLHLDHAAFKKVTENTSVQAIEFGSNIHKHAKHDGVLLVCVVRMEPVVIQ